MPKIQNLRSSVTTLRPGAGSQEAGTIYTNFPDGQLGVIDVSKNPQDLIAVRYFRTDASYDFGDFVVADGILYKAKAIITPSAFTPANWDSVGDETVLSIQAKRPLKTIDGNSLEGSGDFPVLTIPSTSQSGWDWNDMQTAGCYRGDGNTTNRPTVSWNGFETVFIYTEPSQGYVVQTAIAGPGTEIATRRLSSGSWSTWAINVTETTFNALGDARYFTQDQLVEALGFKADTVDLTTHTGDGKIHVPALTASVGKVLAIKNTNETEWVDAGGGSGDKVAEYARVVLSADQSNLGYITTPYVIPFDTTDKTTDEFTMKLSGGGIEAVTAGRYSISVMTSIRTAGADRADPIMDLLRNGNIVIDINGNNLGTTSHYARDVVGSYSSSAALSIVLDLVAGEIITVQFRKGDGTSNVGVVLTAKNTWLEMVELVASTVITGEDVNAIHDNVATDQSIISNLGFGVPAPTEKIDVLGNIKLSGNIITGGLVDSRNVALDGTNQDNHIADSDIHLTQSDVTNNSAVAINTTKVSNVDHITVPVDAVFTDTLDHPSFTGRNTADSHPIGAITGLQTALNNKAEEDEFVGHIESGTLHYAMADIDHALIQHVGTISHDDIEATLLTKQDVSPVDNKLYGLKDGVLEEIVDATAVGAMTIQTSTGSNSTINNLVKIDGVATSGGEEAQIVGVGTGTPTIIVKGKTTLLIVNRTGTQQALEAGAYVYRDFNTYGYGAVYENTPLSRKDFITKQYVGRLAETTEVVSIIGLTTANIIVDHIPYKEEQPDTLNGQPGSFYKENLATEAGVIDGDVVASSTALEWNMFSQIHGTSTNMFNMTNNANGMLDINVHPGDYNHQLGFSSDTNLYHRRRGGGNFNSWNKILTTGNFDSSNVLFDNIQSQTIAHATGPTLILNQIGVNNGALVQGNSSGGYFALGSSSTQTGTVLRGYGDSYFSYKVGIGDSSPSYLLDVAGTARVTNALIVTNTGSNVVPALQESRFSGYGMIGNRGSVYITNAYSTGDIRFGIGGAHGSGLKMTISSSGDVGIGTDAPVEKLDVHGNIRLTGNMILGDQIDYIENDQWRGLTHFSTTGNSMDPNFSTAWAHPLILSNHANTPDSGLYWYIRTKNYNTTARSQTAQAYNGTENQMYIRRYYNSWSNWDKVVVLDDGVLNLKNSSDPSTPSSSANIYSKNGEMHVQDASGNITQISPHNDEGDWEYYSENKLTGKKIKINMEKMIRTLEKFTGETFIEEF